ncbi:MAG: proton-conducting membrane transporter [Actinomycetota bacterium]|nr:proton-conducting membrane transporter [Actinomycetota bacterium]
METAIDTSRLLSVLPGPSLEDHIERWGPPQSSSTRRRKGRRSTDLIDEVEASGLRGRGGGAFPTGRKLRAVAKSPRGKVVVVNGIESEPVSSKDAMLLTQAPHLVLDGAAAAAAALGAHEVLVCIRREELQVRRALVTAIRSRVEANIDQVIFRAFAVPDRYIAGEETALVRWLNGGEVKPTFGGPRPFDKGVDRQATLVQNVETLAHVALIARFGTEWFRSVGLPGDPGTTLLTVSGAVHRPAVIETATGATLAHALELVQGATAPLQAFLIGGYFGTWIAPDDAGEVLLAHDPNPGSPPLGCGAVVALGQDACGLFETSKIVRYMASENAGQCGPCVFGLQAIAEAMERFVASGEAKALDDLRRWSAQIEGRGACRHPDGAVRLLASALATFDDEVDSHLRGSCCGQRPTLGEPSRLVRQLVWR